MQAPALDGAGTIGTVPIFQYSNQTRTITGAIPFEPSAAAMASLRRGHFVPLHNFHPAMCRAAFDSQSIRMNDTIALQVEGDSVSFVREGGLPQKGVRKDSELSFEEFELAFAGLIAKMKECTQRYSPEVIKDVYLFFHKLMAHGSRSEPYGPEAILLYAAVTRQHWHSCFLNVGQGGPQPFRLSVINEATLESYRQKLQLANL